MKSGIRVVKIIGIPIELHVSWFLIFGLLTWSLASGLLPQEYPALSGVSLWLLGMVTSLLFFGSVLAHELGHSVLALRNNVPVRKITLFIFGGIAEIEKEPPTPGAEFRIAIAGPLVSLRLAAIFGGLYLLDQAVPYLAAPSIWLARINLILAVFNMIPGFPLDGGRVLRAAIWQFSGNYRRATQIAASIGQIAAYGFIGFGIFEMFRGRFIDGLWLVFIGSFLNNAASNSATLARVQESLTEQKVGQIMQREFPRVSALTSLQRLVDDYILSGGQPVVLVGDGIILQGVLTLNDITALPQRKWPLTVAQQVMSPIHRLPQVSTRNTLWDALQTMDQSGVEQVTVQEEGRFLGILTREQVLQYMSLRTRLGI